MSLKFLKITHNKPVTTIGLNRPDVHNAFNDEMIQELREAFHTLGADSGVRIIILAAEGKSFCAGADLNWMRRMMTYTLEENKTDARALAEMLKTIYDCPKPVIARVHGNAFGGGVGLISACDMAVATESALFALSEVKLGLIPAVISPFVLRKLSVSSAHQYFLTGERFDAQEAWRGGLLNAVVSDEAALDAWVQKRVENILSSGPEAVQYAKRLIHDVLQPDWPRLIDTTTRLIAERRASAEGQEGMTAFLEKRKPTWHL